MIMKKNVLALSVAAALGGGIVGSANAVLYVESAGLGHALITPYFSTQDGNATLISITNTDGVYGKAVKVRFRSAVDSDDIFDFQVFLSPSDVWTGMVSADAGGLSMMTTADKSCTLPTSVNESFVTLRLQEYTDNGGATHTVTEQTREGYIEIFNMGDIPKFLPNGAAAAAWGIGGPVTNLTTGARNDYTASTNANALYTAIKHVSGVAPCTPATLLDIEENNTTAGATVTAPIVTGLTTTLGAANYATGQQLIAPTGGLMGNWTIINVPKTLVFTGDMTAIRAYNTAAPVEQTMVVYSGQEGLPRSATHVPAANAANVFPALRLTEDGVLLNSGQTGVATSDFDFPDMSTPYEAIQGTDATPGRQAFNLSTAIQRGTVVNEFMTNPDVVGGTDWVLSMPTRRYHVAGRGANYGAAGDTLGYPTGESADDGYTGGGVTLPFVAASIAYAANGRSSCINTGTSPGYFDREETGASGGTAVISPGLPSKYLLCGEVNVLSWNNAGGTSVLAAALTRANANSGSVTKDGWGSVSLGGLPVLGSAFVKAFNANATAGVSGNYGGAFTHRYK